MNIREAMSAATRSLGQAGVDEPARQAASLLRFALDKPPTFLIAHPEYELTRREQEAFSNYVSRRSRREPLQYITGRQEFWGLEFDVEPDVLIPRPETEILVEAAIKRLQPWRNPTFCEVGVGSGCITVSILHTVKDSSAVATDVSQKALDLARNNAEKHGVADRLRSLRTDLLDGVGDNFHAIVANPPYIPSRDIRALQPEVRDFEPRLALDGGADGLDVVRRLVYEAYAHLRSGGSLFIEIGYGQRDAVLAFFDARLWADPVFLDDLQNIPRVVSAERL